LPATWSHPDSSRTAHEMPEIGDHESLKSLTLILWYSGTAVHYTSFNMSHHIAVSFTGSTVINPIFTVPAY